MRQKKELKDKVVYLEVRPQNRRLFRINDSMLAITAKSIVQIKPSI